MNIPIGDSPTRRLQFVCWIYWDSDKNDFVRLMPGDSYTRNRSVLLTAEWEEMYLAGDITGDGKVNIFDVVRLLKKTTSEDVQTFANPNVTGDGKINIFDVVRLLKFVTGEKVEVH